MDLIDHALDSVLNPRVLIFYIANQPLPILEIGQFLPVKQVYLAHQFAAVLDLGEIFACFPLPVFVRFFELILLFG